MFFKEWQHTVIEHIGDHQRVHPVVEYYERDASIGVNEDLLIDASDAFESADIVQNAPSISDRVFPTYTYV